jgi:hypothetical protein
MKSLVTLHLSLLGSLSQLCSVDTARDAKYVRNRVEDEGDGFLTITLPLFAKALERGLEDGLWPRQVVTSFGYHRGLPTFMSGFLTRIFDRDGVLLDDPDTDCIWAVRQFCYLTHKIEREATPERVSAAYAQFVKTDAELMGLPGRIDLARLHKFVRQFHKLFGELCSEWDRKIAHYELVPKHGPGSVADRLSQKEKRDYDYWTHRLEGVFPFWRYTRNTGYASSGTMRSIDCETPVRVITVPKTQATPRIIAIEPSSVQYAQQGLKREMYEDIGRHRDLSQILGFRDQSRNRAMARSASITGSHATLDLSEASDRVHWYLIFQMFRHFPHLWDFVWATRSMKASVPGHGVIPLQKYASMGSALTFPLEAMVFTTLAACGMNEGSEKPFRARDLVGLLSVYGDDIIVPVDTTAAVIDWLEHFGAKVNRRKSFWTGKFRESCGAEYYDGTDVSVVRTKHELPSSRRDAAELAALVDLRNRAYRAGLWSFCADIEKSVSSLYRLRHHQVTPEQVDTGESLPFIGYDSFTPVHHRDWRVNHDLQTREIVVPVLKALSETYALDDEAGLLEWFHHSLRQADLVDRYDKRERGTSFFIKRARLEI